MDLLLIGLYLPPRPAGPKQAQKYRTTVEALFKKLEKTLQAAAGRTMPLIGMDLNDNLGLQKQGRWWQPSFDRHVGKFMPGQEHYASQELRRLMVQFDLAAYQHTLQCRVHLLRQCRKEVKDRLPNWAGPLAAGSTVLLHIGKAGKAIAGNKGQRLQRPPAITLQVWLRLDLRCETGSGTLGY